MGWPQMKSTCSRLHAGRTADAALQELEENYRKYKYIEQELRQSRVRLMTKVPDIAKALSAVQLLIQKQGADQEVSPQFFIILQAAGIS